jgi:ABC-2 type transport system permease protein/lipopolysaccharide transport system permease protein
MTFVAGRELDYDNVARLPAAPGRAMLAWRDLAAGWQRRWMWGALAVQDIKLRYRGSLLGPFWLTLSTAIMVVAMGIIYPYLFHMDAGRYIPYLAVGLIVWQTLSAIANEGCTTFLAEESVIQQVPVPFSIHAYRCVCRNFLVLGHNLAIVPVGMLILRTPVDWRLVMVVPGLLLLAINGVWLSTLLGMVSARFRDVPPIVASFIQVLFFVTPVFWPLDALGVQWRSVVAMNPFFAALDIIRAPLLGEAPAATSWPIMLLTTAVGCGVGFVLFARFRTRIAYWV